MPSAMQVETDELGAEERGLHAGKRIAAVEATVDGAGRIGAKMRRPDALNAPALLVDEHRRILALRAPRGPPRRAA